jgi:hypothetical protein
MVICKKEGCDKNASYSVLGDGAKFCKKHKSNEMVDVVSKRCIECDLRQPCYNFDGEKPKYCKKCKKDGMIDVKNKKCIKCKKKQCTYNFVGLIADYCIDCKSDGMVDTKNKKCIECKKAQPSFNFDGESPMYCGTCKKDGMINLTETRICVKCKKTQATIGYPGESRTHCVGCKEDDMIDVAHNKCIKCKLIQPSFGFQDSDKTHCYKCKEYGMINLVNKRCKSEFCDTIVSNIFYEGYCAYCYANLFPDSPIIKNFKTKERKVVDFIRNIFPNYDWKFDIIVKDGCSKRRPDIYLDFGNFIIIIEVDENQHIKYDCTCENRRVMEISQDVNHRPVVFIRFNPDKYYDKNNKKIPSCFSVIKKTGALKITDKKIWNERLNNLKNTTEYWIKHGTEKTLEVIQMYYDEN